MMKVDLRKAFDSIHWEFLETLLSALHFPSMFTQWIMACISNVEFHLHANGRIHGFFKGKRGLRQGDPLSPLLFVLAMEYLSRLMQKASTLPQFNHHPHCKALNLTHLMFADDLLLFGRADIHTIRIIKDTLDQFTLTTGLAANLHKSQIYVGGCLPTLHHQCLQVSGFQEGALPMKYLGIPISASRLTKLDCSILVDKIRARVHIWASRNLSFAGRATLINSVIFGMFNYWASMFLIPQNVLDKITTVCRNYLWGGKEEYTRAPHISWANACRDKKYGGIGIKEFTAWNKATIAKLVWAVANKKDTLWVKWVHGRYIRNKDWWDYQPPLDCSWTWKKLCSMKELFKTGCPLQKDWSFQGKPVYKIKTGYKWLMGGSKVPWDRVIWARASIPRHAFIAWVYVQRRLPTKVRLNKYIHRNDLQCTLCYNAAEDDNHLFAECPYAMEVWNSLLQWWPLPFKTHQLTLESMTASILRSKAPKAHKQITSAIYAAAIYFIWQARNQLLFKNRSISAQATVISIKEQIRHRILFLSTLSSSYSKLVDVLLH